MDVELARTFLSIVQTRSFMHAAEQLNISQTTVSARIRTLEQQLGRPLFIRSRHGTSLTPAGEEFLRYAPTFVQLWQRMRRQVVAAHDRRAVLTVGSEPGLWHPWLAELLLAMRRSAPEIALRAQVGPAEVMIDAVAEGTLDIAVVCTPHPRPGVRAELLLEEKLVLVSTEPDATAADSAHSAGYVYVDWGETFTHHHGLAWPDAPDPVLIADHGPLALAYLLAAGGSGYFRERDAAPLIAEGRLHPIAGALNLPYPVYAVTSGRTLEALADMALTGLRGIVASAPGTPRVTGS